MITTPRRYKHPSTGANKPSHFGVTVNINAEFNLMAVEPIIECCATDLVTECCQGLQSSVDYTSPPIFVGTLPGRSYNSLPCLPSHIYVLSMFPTFLTSHIYIGLCLPKAIALTRPRSCEMFQVLLVVRINKSLGFQEFSTPVC